MYRHTRGGRTAAGFSARFKSLTALAFALAADIAAAAPVLEFGFDTDDGSFLDTPSFAAAGLVATPFQDLDGTLADGSGNPGRAIIATGFRDGNALAFTLRIDPAYRLDLTGFAFDQRASATGPTQWQLRIGTEAVASGPTSAGFASQAAPLALYDLAGQVEVVLAGSGASSAQGTLRLDNFTLAGTVHPVPLPPALAGFGAGLFALAARRRGSCAQPRASMLTATEPPRETSPR
ncbi:MAG: hypothetical protein AB7Q97_23145 [Gammaproteobacteria bacterium]